MIAPSNLSIVIHNLGMRMDSAQRVNMRGVIWYWPGECSSFVCTRDVSVIETDNLSFIINTTCRFTILTFLFHSIHINDISKTSACEKRIVKGFPISVALTRFFLTRFNKIAIQGTPQMAVD